MMYKINKEDAVNVGDYYYDDITGYYYMWSGSGFTTFFDSTITTASSYTGYNNISSKSYIDSSLERNNIKNYLKENPDLMDELIREIRNEKI